MKWVKRNGVKFNENNMHIRTPCLSRHWTVQQAYAAVNIWSWAYQTKSIPTVYRKGTKVYRIRSNYMSLHLTTKKSMQLFYLKINTWLFHTPFSSCWSCHIWGLESAAYMPLWCSRSNLSLKFHQVNLHYMPLFSWFWLLDIPFFVFLCATFRIFYWWFCQFAQYFNCI